MSCLLLCVNAFHWKPYRFEAVRFLFESYGFVSIRPGNLETEVFCFFPFPGLEVRIGFVSSVAFESNMPRMVYILVLVLVLGSFPCVAFTVSFRFCWKHFHSILFRCVGGLIFQQLCFGQGRPRAATSWYSCAARHLSPTPTPQSPSGRSPPNNQVLEPSCHKYAKIIEFKFWLRNQNVKPESSAVKVVAVSLI